MNRRSQAKISGIFYKHFETPQPCPHPPRDSHLRESMGSTLLIKMAASFGVWEVKFPSSRAVYDDEDDEDEDPSMLEEYSKSIAFHWAPHIVGSSQTSPTSGCPLLVLAVGEVATTFLEAHFLTAGNEIVACITSKKDSDTNFETLCSAAKSTDDSFLYQLTTIGHDESVICQCRNPVPQEKAFYWTEKVRRNIRAISAFVKEM